MQQKKIALALLAIVFGNATFATQISVAPSDDLVSAVANASAGDTIMLLPGTHAVTNTVKLNKANLTLYARDGKETTFITAATPSAHLVAMSLGAVGVTVSNITFTGIKGDDGLRRLINGLYAYPAGAVVLENASAVMRDCIVSNCLATYTGSRSNSNSGDGGLVRITAGTADRMLICANRHAANRSGADTYAGRCVTLNGASAVLMNSLVVSNTMNAAPGVTVYGGATVLNCTIADNRGVQSCTASVMDESLVTSLYVNNGTVVNTISTRNTGMRYKSTLAYELNFLVGASATFSNCCLGTAIGENPVLGTPAFLDGTYALSPASPCVNSGVAWSCDDASASLDALGNPRISHAIDVGAAELQLPASGYSFAGPGGRCANDGTAVFRPVAASGDLPADIAFSWSFDCGDGAPLTFNTTGAQAVTVSDDLAAGKAYSVSLSWGSGSAFEYSPGATIERAALRYYVAATSTTADYPWSNETTAGTNLLEVWNHASAFPNTELVLLPGIHLAENTIFMRQTGATLSSSDKNTTIVKSASSGFRMALDISGANTTVSNLTFTGYKGTEMIGAFYLHNATAAMRDCIVSNCYATLYGTGGGQSSGYGLIRVTSGLLDRMLISHNRHAANINYDTENKQGKCVVLAGANAEIRNSIVAHNAMNASPGIVLFNGAKAVNCTICDNETLSPGDAGFCAALYVNGSSALNCVSFGNVISASAFKSYNANLCEVGTCTLYGICSDAPFGEAPRIGPPMLSPVTYAPRSSTSPCVEKGLTQDWALTDGAIDYAGRKRLSGLNIDIGAVEYQFPEEGFYFTISEKRLPENDTTGIVLSVISAVTGLDFATTEFTWTLDDGVNEPITFTTTGSASPDLRNLPIGRRYAVTLSWTENNVQKTYPETLNEDDKIERAPLHFYVAAENSGAAYPWSTPETAATNIVEVYAKSFPSGEITLLPGTHILDEGIDIDKSNFVIRGENGVIVSAGGKRMTAFTLNADNVIVSNITVTSVLGDEYRGVIRLNNLTALFVDCVVSNCRGSCYGTSGSPAASFGMIRVEAGTVDRALITKNRNGLSETSGNSANKQGKTVVLVGADSVIRNSLITDNVMGICPGIVLCDGAKAHNCTIVSNESKESSLASYEESRQVAALYSEGGEIVNCVSFGNAFAAVWQDEHNPNICTNSTGDIENNCFDVDFGTNTVVITDATLQPLFKDGGYKPAKDSPLIDAGKGLAWADEPGVKDYYGDKRRRGTLDIGCAEFSLFPSMIMLR